MRETLQCEYPDDLVALLDKRQQLTAVLSVPPLARPWRRATRDGPCVSVEVGQRDRHSLHLGSSQLPARQPRHERAPLVVAAHLDQIVDRARIVLGCQLKAICAARDRAHAEVQLGRQAPVQAHLLTAHLAATRWRPVVQERQQHRLVEFVGTFARQKDPRDVRLAHNHPRRRGRVEARTRQHRLQIIGCRQITVGTRIHARGGARRANGSVWALSHPRPLSTGCLEACTRIPRWQPLFRPTARAAGTDRGGLPLARSDGPPRWRSHAEIPANGMLSALVRSLPRALACA